jgi:hypothetical protein
MSKRQFDGFLYFLNLGFEASDIGVRLQRGFIHFHDVQKRVLIVLHDSHHRVIFIYLIFTFVVHEDTAAGFQLVFVYETHDCHVVFRAVLATYDGMIFIDKLLQRSH